MLMQNDGAGTQQLSLFGPKTNTRRRPKIESILCVNGDGWLKLLAAIAMYTIYDAHLKPVRRSEVEYRRSALWAIYNNQPLNDMCEVAFGKPLPVLAGMVKEV